MQAMKGATMALGSMNKTMNLPSLQRIAMEFERENDIMEQRQEMMDDAIDDAMDVGVEEEGDEVIEQVLEEIGVDLSQSVRGPLFTAQARFTNNYGSWERHLQVCNRMPPRKAESHRLLVGAGEATRAMMIFKHGWTASDDEVIFHREHPTMRTNCGR